MKYRNWITTFIAMSSCVTGLCRAAESVRPQKPNLLFVLTDPYQINPIYRGQGQDELMDRMHQALAEHLKEQDDPFLEKVWVARADKTGAPDTARYDALVERYYTIDLTR